MNKRLRCEENWTAGCQLPRKMLGYAYTSHSSELSSSFYCNSILTFFQFSTFAKYSENKVFTEE